MQWLLKKHQTFQIKRNYHHMKWPSILLKCLLQCHTWIRSIHLDKNCKILSIIQTRIENEDYSNNLYLKYLYVPVKNGLQTSKSSLWHKNPLIIRIFFFHKFSRIKRKCLILQTVSLFGNCITGNNRNTSKMFGFKTVMVFFLNARTKGNKEWWCINLRTRKKNIFKIVKLFLIQDVMKLRKILDNSFANCPNWNLNFNKEDFYYT